MMNELYPIQFIPQFKERIWGGTRLAGTFGKKLPAGKPIGESWELSTVEDSVSLIANGFLEGNNLQEIIEIYMGDLMGEAVYEHFGDEFPLLFKLIDAEDILSVQVHPDDATAKAKHKAYGKNEMWYILDAEPGATIINGFNQDTNREEVARRLEDGSLAEILNEVEVKAGDVYFIPAGRIHAIGKGILLAEIQQSSDVTYRVFDWNRTDSEGNPRELHIELALDVLDYEATIYCKTNYKPELNKSVPVIQTPYFNMHLVKCSNPVRRDYTFLESFVVYFCTEGQVDVRVDGTNYGLQAGSCMLIPEEIKELEIIPLQESSLLEVYLPAKA